MVNIFCHIKFIIGNEQMIEIVNHSLINLLSFNISLKLTTLEITSVSDNRMSKN